MSVAQFAVDDSSRWTAHRAERAVVSGLGGWFLGVFVVRW